MQSPVRINIYETRLTSNPVSRLGAKPHVAVSRPSGTRSASQAPPDTNSETVPGRTFRVLIVDDNRAIHADFRKTLCPADSGLSDLLAAGAELFNEEQPAQLAPAVTFELESATQGQEALEMVRKALAAGRPYALAFMDVRMPPGWDGIETTARIWEVDPALQVVICTAYTDYSFSEVLASLGRSDRFVILKKPFDVVEVQQLANAFTEKWRLLHQVRETQANLEKRVVERTEELASTQARLEHLLRSSPAIIYSMPAAGPRAFSFLSQNVSSVLGLAPEELATDGAWSRHLFPDDAAKASERHAELLRLGQYRAEYRFLHQDGSYRWLQDEARVLRDAQGQPSEIVGYCVDMTSLKEYGTGPPANGSAVAPGSEARGHRPARRRHRPRNQHPDAIRRRQHPLSPGLLRRACSRLLQSYQRLAGRRERQHPHARTDRPRRPGRSLPPTWLSLRHRSPPPSSNPLEGVERVTKIVRAMKEFSHPGSRGKSPLPISTTPSKAPSPSPATNGNTSRT